jgi:hypothetical protein
MAQNIVEGNWTFRHRQDRRPETTIGVSHPLGTGKANGGARANIPMMDFEFWRLTILSGVLVSTVSKPRK